MKRYCKQADVTDIGFIKKSILDCFEKKYKKRKVIGFLANFERNYTQDSNITKKEVSELYSIYGVEGISFIVEHIAKDMQEHIINRDISLPPVRFVVRYDYNSCKFREIGIEHMMQQCYEYVAVNACMELFQAKIGRYQCASIPKRGQLYGVKGICRWLENSPGSMKYFVKLDVRKCYPSIEQKKIKQLLHRDIKNDTLLYLLEVLIDSFIRGGLSIGSHLSQWLCNYYLSYAYHYNEQELFIEKRSGKRVRLISHQLFYMDDILLCGSNKKYLKIAVDRDIKYFKDNLGLDIKPIWGIQRFIYFDKKTQSNKGVFIDMMGYKIYRNKIAIRKTINIKVLRKLRKINKKIDNHQKISLKDCRTLCSYYGFIKNSNSFKLKNKYQVARCMRISRKIMSNHSQKENYRKNADLQALKANKGEFYNEYLQNQCTS